MFGSNKDKNKDTIDKANTTQSSSVPVPKTITPVQASETPSVTQLPQTLESPQNQSSESTGSNFTETLISESCRVEGNIHSDKSIKVEGKVEGNIHVKQALIISAKGMVEGDVIAESLIVYGHLKGNSQLKDMHIQNGGHIDGDIKTQSLNVDPNATYNGVVTMTKDSLQPASSTINKKTSIEDKPQSVSLNQKSKSI